MGKYYGNGGKKVGKVGNEKYYINRGENIVQTNNKYYPVNSTLLKKKEFKEYVLSLLEEGIPQIYIVEELPEEEKFPISCAIGVAYGDGLHSIKEILELADQRMYENKREMKAERTDNNTSAESPKQDGEFNPNFDGYYNDVEAAIEEEEKEFSKEQFGKALGLIVGTIAFIIIFEIIINSIM